MTQPRFPGGWDPQGPSGPPPGPPPGVPVLVRRPATATGAAALGVLYGTGIAAVGLFGAWWTAAWTADAPPGEERGIGGVLAIVLCLIGVGIGSSMAVRGRDLARGGPNAADRLLATFGLLTGLSGMGTVTGLLDDSLPADEWRLRLLLFAGVFVVSLTGVLLCRAQPTRMYSPTLPRRTG